MVTIDQIIGYFEQVIAENRLRGKKEDLLHLQYAAGLLMQAAEHAGDKATAGRFRLVAAQAANRREELEGE